LNTNYIEVLDREALRSLSLVYFKPLLKRLTYDDETSPPEGRAWGGPNPLHSTFNDYIVTNRSMRRSKKMIARMLKEAVRNGQMLTYRQILDEMKR
jgi:hypothetical protein